MGDNFAKAGVQSRFTRTGQGYLISLAVIFQPMVNFGNNFTDFDKVLALKSMPGCSAQLAEYTIIAAGFERCQIDAE
jgi:hypothetical protein